MGCYFLEKNDKCIQLFIVSAREKIKKLSNLCIQLGFNSSQEEMPYCLNEYMFCRTDKVAVKMYH